MAVAPPDLGIFSADQGARTRAGMTGLVLSCAAGLAVLVRIVLDEVDAGTDHSAITRLALALAVLGLLGAFLGLFDIATRARRGRGMSKAALALGGVAAIGAYVYSSTHSGALRLGNFATSFFDLDLLGRMSGDLLRGAKNTLVLALTAEVLSLAFGLVVAILRLSPRKLIRWPAGWYVDVIRATPLIVLAYLISGGLPKLGLVLDPFWAGTLALTLNAGAYVAEIFRAGLQSVPRGQADAARSLGMPHSMSMLYVVIPQAVRNVVPPLMSEFIALTKDTAVVVVASGFTLATADLFGIGRTFAASTFSPTPFIGATLGYVILLIPLIRFVGIAERRLRLGLT